MGDCGDLSGDDAGNEILWAFFLYGWPDDVNLRQPTRDRKGDNRVAENMANMAKEVCDSFRRCSLSECAYSKQ